MTMIAAWLYLTLVAVLAPKGTGAFQVRLAPTVNSRCQPLHTTKDDNLPHRDRQQPSSRRKILREAAQSVVGVGVGVLLPSRATAESDVPTSDSISMSVPIRASWTSINGLNANDDVVAFNGAAYKAMKDDPTRTPLFQQAIFNRLGKNPESLTVIDLGTGPFALFAIMAAQLGAGRVYAMESNREAARSARITIVRAGFQDVITVLDGYSTDIKLPNDDKADFCIAEIIGSIATEEGAYATIRDAHKRFLKNPELPSSWIPRQIQTYAAPASYTLHNLFGPPEFNWNKLDGEHTVLDIRLVYVRLHSFEHLSLYPFRPFHSLQIL
jgi:16S rRNA G966 N2-methylase RsmD